MAFWYLDPMVLLSLLAVMGAYLLGVGPLRQRYGWAERVGRGRVLSFALGMLALAAALISPLHEVGERFLFTAHIIQYELLTLVAAPLLLVGTPGWLLRPLLRLPGALPAARALTHPVTCYGLFGLVFALWHVPLFFAALLEQPVLHAAAYVVLILSAVLTWWPIFSPLPECPRLPSVGQMVYLLAQMFPCSAIGIVVSLSDEVLFAPYAAAPRLWGLSALADQQIGGVIMWGGGNLFWMVAAVIVFFIWADRQEAQSPGGAAPASR
ncbi:MAG: cytochrome c oxidase assembly protein [Chloroflexi bacterium]|nr:cytochrome c oxidase assembly protein [Chloroflexota bacterium]